MNTSMRPRSQWWFLSQGRLGRLIRGIFIAFVGVIVLECAARVLVTFHVTPGESGNELEMLGLRSSAELGWERNPNFEGSLPREPGHYKRTFDSQGFFVVADDGGRQALTILTLGDSSTFGWGAPPESSFPRVLARLLPETRVINLGVLGHSSFQGYKTLLRYAPILKPNLIIVSFNYNDRRYVLSSDDEDGDAKFRREHVARRIIGLARRLYLFRVLRGALWSSGIVTPPVSAQGVIDDVRTLHARVPPEKYRENLRRFAEFGRQARIPLIFVIMKDNPAYTDYLRQGIALFHRARYDLAARKLEVAVHLENAFSEVARKYLVLALEKQGAFEEAKQVARIDGPLFYATGGKPVYLDVEYNEIMRSVAKEYGIEVVDAAKALEKDPSMYVDYCHPNRRGYEVIARLLEQPARRLLRGQPVDRRSLAGTAFASSGSMDEGILCRKLPRPDRRW